MAEPLACEALCSVAQGTVMYFVEAAQSLTAAGQLVTVTVLVMVTGSWRSIMEAEATEAKTETMNTVLRILCTYLCTLEEEERR